MNMNMDDDVLSWDLVKVKNLLTDILAADPNQITEDHLDLLISLIRAFPIAIENPVVDHIKNFKVPAIFEIEKYSIPPNSNIIFRLEIKDDRSKNI